MNQAVFHTLEDCFKRTDQIIMTAHAGYIGRYPEDSLMGLEAAAALGCDMIEFDLRTTSDNVVVLHHDKTIDRTSDGSGLIAELSYEEIKKYNFSYYEYFPDCSGRKRKTPRYEEFPITRFDAMLEKLAKKVMMNIQIYRQQRRGLQAIAGLFRDFDLYQTAYCTMDTFEEASMLRSIDPDIELCVLARPLETSKTTIAMLHDFHDFGCRFAQPRWFDITPEYCEASRKLGICSNVYYANYQRDAERFIKCGINGILTDYPDLLLPVVRKG